MNDLTSTEPSQTVDDIANRDLIVPHWEHFSHGADIGVRGIAGSMAEAFEQAALAMTAVITEPELVACHQTVEVNCEASDPEILLADWLNALIYQMAINKMLFACFEVTLTGSRLHGKAQGESVNVSRHSPAVEIKGATYTELKVTQQADGSWLAQCVVDV